MCPLPHLSPEDPALKREALDWEDELDTDLGPATRALVLDATFRHPGAVVRELAVFEPPFFELGLRIMAPGLRIAGAAARALGPSRRSSRITIDAVLEKIEEKIEDHDYLVGGEFTVADLTAASLLSPIMEVAEFPYAPESGFPSSVRTLREDYASSPAIRWAKGVYGRHRTNSEQAASEESRRDA